jgi:hypothetical protein
MSDIHAPSLGRKFMEKDNPSRLILETAKWVND